MKTLLSGLPAQLGRLLVLAAAAIAFYLTALSFGSTPLAGCGEGTGCHAVLQSYWSHVLGLPVSFAGVLACVAMLATAGAWERRDGTVLDTAASIAACAILTGAAWFLVLQAGVLHQWCVWCTAAHACAVLGTGLLFLSRRQTPLPDKPERMLITPALAVVGSVALVILGPAVGSPEARTDIARFFAFSPAPVAAAALPPVVESTHPILLAEGAVTLNPDDFPAIGSGDEARRLVMLADYTCDYSRRAYEVMDHYVKNHPGTWVVLLPAARTRDGAEIQQTMLTLYHTHREQWEILHRELLAAVLLPTPENVGKRAMELAGGPQAWAQAWQTWEPRTREWVLAVRQAQEAHRKVVAAGTLPQLLAGVDMMAGLETDELRLDRFIVTGLQNARNHPPGERPALPVSAPARLESDAVTDLGEVAYATPVPVNISVRNSGRMPARVGWLNMDTGCEVTELPTGEIPPGGSALVKLLVLPPTSGAAFERRVEIHDDTGLSMTTALVRGTVEAP